MHTAPRANLWKLGTFGLVTLVGLAGILPAAEPATSGPAWEKLAPFFQPPAALANDFGGYESPLAVPGGEITNAEGWPARRAEILKRWRLRLGDWPALLEKPEARILESERRDNFTQHRIMLQVAPPHKGSRTGESLETNAILMVPDGPGPFPAVLVTFYEPLSSAGLMKDMKGNHDYAYQLAKRGYLTLAIGTPGSRNFGRDTRPALNELGENYGCQPLGFLAYVAANCHTFLARRPDADRDRIGVVGLSYGGKWAMFASCLYDKFSCAVWADPGIVFDESNRNINYYEPWYLGFDMRTPQSQRKPGAPTADNPRTGLYKELMDAKAQLIDLHALAAPRPVLVSGGTEDKPERWKALNHLVRLNKLLGHERRVGLTSRETHVPDPLATEQTLQFFDAFLKAGGPAVAELGPGAPPDVARPAPDVMLVNSRETARDAVSRGLAVLQKGAKSYPSHRQCFSCHHQTMPLLAMKTVQDGLSPGEGGPEANPLTIDLKLLESAAKFSHQAFAGKYESLNKGEGIGGKALTVGYGLWTLDLAGWPSDFTTDAMIEYLLKTQESDGHWNFHSTRPPASSSIEMTSAISLFGLVSYRNAGNAERVDAALRRAKKWFQAQGRQQESHEDLIGAIWGRWLASQLFTDDENHDRDFPDETANSLHILRDRQRHDGGWSQLPAMESDAYATGQALVMMQQISYAGRPDNETCRRGLAFLLNTQKPDGSWHVATRAKPVQAYFDNGDPHGKDQFISIMATGWATTALAADLGNVSKPLRSRAISK